jgi:hypothetical protein
LLGPNTINTPAPSGDPGVVAEEKPSRFLGIGGPRVILKADSATGRARQYHNLPSILRVTPPIVKNDVGRAVRRIDALWEEFSKLV